MARDLKNEIRKEVREILENAHNSALSSVVITLGKRSISEERIRSCIQATTFLFLGIWLLFGTTAILRIIYKTTAADPYITVVLFCLLSFLVVVFWISKIQEKNLGTLRLARQQGRRSLEWQYDYPTA